MDALVGAIAVVIGALAAAIAATSSALTKSSETLAGSIFEILRRLVGGAPSAPRQPISPEDFRRQRVDRLVRAFRDAELLAGEIQAEIQQGLERAEALDEELAQKAALANTTPEQVAAIEAMVQAEFDDAGRRSLRQQVWIGALYFLAGVGVTIGATLLFGH